MSVVLLSFSLLSRVSTKEDKMRHARFISLPFAALVLAIGCNRSERPREQARSEPARAEAAQELQRKRADDGARLDKRVAEMEGRYQRETGQRVHRPRGRFHRTAGQRQGQRVRS